MSDAVTAMTREVQQGIVDDVTASLAGQPEALVHDALLRSFVSQGLEAPPDTWLTNVAVSISEGRTYVVGSHSGVVGAGHPTSGEPMSERHSPLTTQEPLPPARGA